MQVKEVMSDRVEFVGPETTLQECARRMRDLNVGSMPVMQNGKLWGMITDRDICCRIVAEGRDPSKARARDVMAKNVAYCLDDQECEDAAHLMEDRHIRRLAVLDRRHSLVGILSVDNLAHASRDLAGEVLIAARPIH
jgi:CBS domain-containing protein